MHKHERCVGVAPRCGVEHLRQSLSAEPAGTQHGDNPDTSAPFPLAVQEAVGTRALWRS